MWCSDEGGSMLVEILVVLLLISVLAAVILPSGLAFYRRAAVEYEAMRLIGELRRIPDDGAAALYSWPHERGRTRPCTLCVYGRI